MAGGGVEAVSTPLPIVGDFYRDKYGDTATYRNPRMIRITEVLPNGIRAEVVKMMDGTVPEKPRFTTLQFKTLRAAYVLWDTSD